MRAWAAAPSTALATRSASPYSDCRDRSRSWAISVTSPYGPQRTAQALAMRCGIVGMGTRSVEADQGITPTIAHVPTRIVHQLPQTKGRFEKVPIPNPIPILNHQPSTLLRTVFRTTIEEELGKLPKISCGRGLGGGLGYAAVPP
jgi:hypothetical protein